MRIDILTLFPGMFKGPLDESMVKIAKEKDLVNINIHNLRNWTTDRHKSADDKPFGGGAGMVMKIEPVYKAICQLIGKGQRTVDEKIVLLTPQGRRLNQSIVKSMSKLKRMILVCGHYEGVDERVRFLMDEEISIGDYILTCGEIPACVLIDSVVRLIPGVLGKEESICDETFEDDVLEYPQYTRPRKFEGMEVPEVLLRGNHKKISEWRMKQAILRTKERRPDLYEKYKRSKKTKNSV